MLGSNGTDVTSVGDYSFVRITGDKNPTNPKLAVVRAMYEPMPGERFPLPAIDINKVPSKFWRRQLNLFSLYPIEAVIANTKT